MPVPWKEIVQFMPTIIDFSRELLRHTRPPANEHLARLSPMDEVKERLSALEENEQRQVDLSTRMAEQLAQLTAAVTVLHRHVRWLLIALSATAALAVAALVLLALR
jgi:hypothetical protein